MVGWRRRWRRRIQLGRSRAALTAGSACEGAVNATTPACLTGAGGDANGGNELQVAQAALVLAALAVTAVSPSVATAVLAE